MSLLSSTGRPPKASAALDQTGLLTSARPGRWGNLAVEIWMLLSFSMVWLIGVLLFELPVNCPNGNSLRFVQRHYFAPLGIAFLLQLPLILVARRRHRHTDPWMMAKQVPFVVLVVFLHFNFKAWMPFVNQRLYDDSYQRFDQLCAPVLNGMATIRHLIAEASPWNVDGWYHTAFVGMFFVSIAAHAVFDRPARQRQLLLGINLILLLGGVCYWLAPALGPFLYLDGANKMSSEAQQQMLRMFGHVANTGRLPNGYFVAPLAAMPSLHVAHALFLTIFAAASLRWLCIVYVPITFWIVIESVTAGWHYLIDIPFGVAMALICLRFAATVVPCRTASANCPT